MKKWIYILVFFTTSQFNLSCSKPKEPTPSKLNNYLNYKEKKYSLSFGYFGNMGQDYGLLGTGEYEKVFIFSDKKIDFNNPNNNFTLHISVFSKTNNFNNATFTLNDTSRSSMELFITDTNTFLRMENGTLKISGKKLIFEGIMVDGNSLWGQFEGEIEDMANL